MPYLHFKSLQSITQETFSSLVYFGLWEQIVLVSSFDSWLHTMKTASQIQFYSDLLKMMLDSSTC